MATYGYEIHPRRPESGGGWQLRLLRDGEELGGGVFPADPTVEPQQGRDWFNALSVTEQAQWLVKANSARPVDAYGAYLSSQAFLEAQEEGENWVARQP